MCIAVRKAVGDDYRLMLDPTWSYTYTDAVRVGRAIEELGFHWYEDPLADEDIYNYVKLRAKLDIPIMATEFPAGGLTTMLKTAHLAEAFGLKYEIHHSGNSLNNLANLHLCMALRNTTMFEVLLPHGAHKYGMATEIEIDKDGMMHAPNGPGLGADIDFELIARIFVAMRRCQHRKALHFDGQRYRTFDGRAGALRGFDDFAGRLVDQTMIESLQADPNVLISHVN